MYVMDPETRFNLNELYFWTISGISVALIPWIFFGILARSHKTWLHRGKLVKIIAYNVCSVLFWISFAFVVKIFVTRRCCKYLFLPMIQAQIIGLGFMCITAEFFELPSIYNLGWKTLRKMVSNTAGYFAASNAGFYAYYVLIIGVPTRYIFTYKIKIYISYFFDKFQG